MSMYENADPRMKVFYKMMENKDLKEQLKDSNNNVSTVTNDNLENIYEKLCDPNDDVCKKSAEELVEIIREKFRGFNDKFEDANEVVDVYDNSLTSDNTDGILQPAVWDGMIATDDKRELKGLRENDDGINNLVGRRKQIQLYARKHIQSQSPKYMLKELQRLQDKLDFALVDPLVRPYRTKDPPKYTPLDLYQFLSDHLHDDVNHFRRAGDSPFYQPMVYPKDASMDQVLASLISESPYQKFIRLYNQYKYAKSAPEVYKERLQYIYDVLTNKNNKANPYYLTRFVKGQERPMEEYRNEEFLATLNEFSKKKTQKPNVKKIAKLMKK